nr:uncharacterized protein LOC109166016 [Ipomoea batatas]
MVKTQYGAHVKTIRSDNGPEFEISEKEFSQIILPTNVSTELSDESQDPPHTTTSHEQIDSPPLHEAVEQTQSPEQPHGTSPEQSQQPAIRRSTRQKHTPAYLGDYVCHSSVMRTSPHDISKANWSPSPVDGEGDQLVAFSGDLLVAKACSLVTDSLWK